MRGWNALPSMALVLLGAWTGAGKTLLALKHLTGVAQKLSGCAYRTDQRALPVRLLHLPVHSSDCLPQVVPLCSWHTAASQLPVHPQCGSWAWPRVPWPWPAAPSTTILMQTLTP